MSKGLESYQINNFEIINAQKSPHKKRRKRKDKENKFWTIDISGVDKDELLSTLKDELIAFKNNSPRSYQMFLSDLIDLTGENILTAIRLANILRDLNDMYDYSKLNFLVLARLSHSKEAIISLSDFAQLLENLDDRDESLKELINKCIIQAIQWDEID